MELVANALNTEEFLWESALDSTELIAFAFDPWGNRIHHFNRALVDFSGLTAFDLGRCPVTDLFPQDLPKLIVLTEACLDRGRAWSAELSLVSASGQERPVEVFASLFEDRRGTRMLFVCQDVAQLEERRSREELERLYRAGLPQTMQVDSVFRELERGSQLILNAAGEGIYGVNAEGVTTFVNPAAERMLGFKADELVGKLAHAQMHHSHVHGEPYPIKSCPIYAAFRDGAVHRVDDEVFWRKDGTFFPVEYTSTPIQNNGRLVGAVVVFRDVSKRREAETQLRQAVEEVNTLKKRLELENAYLQHELKSEHNYHEIVGNSDAVKQIIRQIELVASTDANVLISGESGTGKELIARAIHGASPRSERPLIRVNCAAIPRELFESEFFGHAKGAFTGAVAERIGRFELADGGTIFLDEVGELPLEQQGKLLRVLQEKQIERVGDTRTIDVDVRVIAATNRDLKSEVREKRFREDLYFRLNVFPIESVPLRERAEDIPVLASLFIRRASERMNRPMPGLSLADVERLQAYSWPGNIRELENCIERAVILSVDERLRIDLPETAPRAEPAPAAAPAIDDRRVLTEAERRAREQENLVEALRASNGRVSGKGGAAELLGVKPTTLYSRLQRHGLDARQFRKG